MIATVLAGLFVASALLTVMTLALHGHQRSKWLREEAERRSFDRLHTELVRRGQKVHYTPPGMSGDEAAARIRLLAQAIKAQGGRVTYLPSMTEPPPPPPAINELRQLDDARTGRHVHRAQHTVRLSDGTAVAYICACGHDWADTGYVKAGELS